MGSSGHHLINASGKPASAQALGVLRTNSPCGDLGGRRGRCEQGSEGRRQKDAPGRGHGLTGPEEGLRGAAPVTILLGRLVVLLAHQPPVLHEVELVPRGQLPVTDDAGKAVQVVNEVLRLADHLGRRDALLAGRAFRAEAPVGAA